MNFSNKKPVRLEKKVTFQEQLEEFWNEYKGFIGVLIVLTCISLLLIIGLMALSKNGVSLGHMVSSDANRYEHMDQIVLYIGGRF